jgi:hypothetical protein
MSTCHINIKPNHKEDLEEGSREDTSIDTLMDNTSAGDTLISLKYTNNGMHILFNFV